MSYLTKDICKVYASSAPATLDALWNDACCKFVKPAGKCGQPATAATCVVKLDIGDQNFSPIVGKDATISYGMIGVGSFGGIQQCGDDLHMKQGTSDTKSSSTATAGAGGAGGHANDGQEAKEKA